MEVDKAIQIIENNYSCVEESFYNFLHEECSFDKKAFWTFFDAITTLAVRSIEETSRQIIALKICLICNRIMKEFIAHFDPNDGVELLEFPNDYLAYLEAIDLALDAFLQRTAVDETRLNVSRPA